jgi:hypothetical protein
MLCEEWRLLGCDAVALVRTDVSEELSASIIRLTRIGELANVVPSSAIPVTLMMEALSSSETLVLTRAIRRTIPEGAILHSGCRENLKSYNMLCVRGGFCFSA